MAFTPFDLFTIITSTDSSSSWKAILTIPLSAYGTPCAHQTVGCRYCKESCVEECGEGVLECNACYTCEGSFSGSYSFQN